MKIMEVHVDFSCPFSYMGGERMIQYLEKNNLPLDRVVFRSFLLNPKKDNNNSNFLENMSQKFGLDIPGTKEKYVGIVRAAEQLGLHYDIEKVVDVNSKNAHIGLQYATIYKQQAAYFRRVMSGHWEKGENFSDLTFIENVIQELGLDVEDFKENRKIYEEMVENDIQLAAKRGVRSVPTFYTEGKIVIQGTGSFEEIDQYMK